MSIQERLYRLITSIGLLGLTFGVVVDIIAGKNIANLIPLIVAIAVFGLITYLTLRFHKIQLGAMITSAIAIYFVLPYNFIMAGGIYGGAAIWFVFGFVFVSLVVEGKGKYILLVSGYILFIGCYYIAYFYPNLIVQHTLAMAHMDSLITLTIVSIITCSMVLFQNSIYRRENETAQKQRDEIENLNKAQSNFFSSMSHEIRTPINTIIGLNEMILREDVSDEVAQDAQNIQGASKMLLTLINDILDMSKIESGKMDIVPVTYDVGAMFSDIVNMIWVRARQKGLEFHIDVDESVPAQLYGDEVRIRQVLINLLNNAVKYTQEGQVTLSVRFDSIDSENTAMISYSVTDTGMGIKKENIPHLFSAFKRVDEEKNRYIEGTGLGLSIVKQLVDLMGGEIAVNSVYTKGSTFVVTLPQKLVGSSMIGRLDLEKKHSMNTREKYKPAFEASKAHVLIVDDNNINLMVAEKLLRDTKVNVDTAVSGAQALSQAALKHYDVIFMDHLMPEMDGIQCFHAIRGQEGGLNNDTPIVILTANAGSENQMLYKREGFDGYLLKPISGMQLETELLKHLPRELVRMTNVEGFTDVVDGLVFEHVNKKFIMITTDSVSDLPPKLAGERGIVVLPYRVFTDEGEFLDGIEIETEGVLSYMSDKGKNARSESPEAKDYEEFFAEQLTRAQYIIHIAMAKNSSKGYENALKASKTFDNVLVVDSGHLSSGMGILALEAERCASEGMSPEEIVKELENIKKRINTSFIVGSTEYLARSGRISAKVNTICEAFMLHPVIMLKKSSMTVAAIRMGMRDTIWRKYIKSTLKNTEDIDRQILFITHAGLTRSELMGIEAQVRKKVDFENVIYQKASPAISANCGPDSFGLLFMRKH